jgi:DcuC family C4-dicarboxylate transporter
LNPELRQEIDSGARKRVDLFKAVVPIIPLVILFLCAKPFGPVHLPKEPGFLVGAKELEDVQPGKAAKKADDLEDTRLIGMAMLVGVVAAAAACLRRKESRKCLPDIAKAFFDGTGFAFAHVISLIAVAACFAEGIKLVGLGEIIGHLASASPSLLLPFAGLAALLFALLCGSGIAATQGLFGIFAAPAAQQGMVLSHIGAFTSLGSAAGRTMSPVAAVSLMSAQLAEADVIDLVKAVALPLLAGFAAAMAYASLRPL